MNIILADLGSLRAFRVVTNINQTEITPILEEIEVPPLSDPPQRLSETVSDQAGRFRSDSSPGSASGEDHGLAQEHEKRYLADVAKGINQLVTSEGAESWALAAPQAINGRLIDLLDPAVAERLRQNLKMDLCKQPILEIQKRFELPVPS
jgi:hypothetical protein